MKLLLSVLALSAALALPGLFAPPPDGTSIQLWPEGVPNKRADVQETRSDDGRIAATSEPTLTYYRPAVDRANGTAVVIAPGGGCAGLSNEREGVQYARWLSTIGASSFVLKYRLKEYGHPAPLQDISRALRIVRSRSGEFAVKPDRIGAMGSSVGGHLAASAGTPIRTTQRRRPGRPRYGDAPRTGNVVGMAGVRRNLAALPGIARSR